MKKLIAQRPVLYLSRSYERGAALPTQDRAMTEAWLRAGSAVWCDDGPPPGDTSVQDTQEPAEEGGPAQETQEPAEEGGPAQETQEPAEEGGPTQEAQEPAPPGPKPRGRKKGGK